MSSYGTVSEETEGLLKYETSSTVAAEMFDPTLVEYAFEDPPSAARTSSSPKATSGTPLRKRVEQFRLVWDDFLGSYKPHQLFRLIWLVIICTSTLIGVPALVLHLYKIESEIRVYLIVVPTVFVFLAVPISLYSIRRHLRQFWVPPLQVFVVRILWMVPVYSVCTLTSLYLWVFGLEPYVYIADCLRQCYEAYTLYNLFSFMITFLEMESGLSAGRVLSRRYPSTSHVIHAPPFSIPLGRGCFGRCVGNAHAGPSAEEENSAESGSPVGGAKISRRQQDRRFEILAPWPMGEGFVHRARRGVLFYVATMPPLALLIVFLSLLNLYHEGNFSWFSPYLWITSFAFCTSCWALYCLALFYVVARSDLKPMKPLAKILLVKGIVFFTWAQSLAISIAFYVVYDYRLRRMTAEAAKAAITGASGNSYSSTISGGMHTLDDNYLAGLEDDELRQAEAAQALADERRMVAGAVCDAVMCVEMLFFAIGHAVAFPASQFERVLAPGSRLDVARRKVDQPVEDKTHSASLPKSAVESAKMENAQSSELGPHKQFLVEWGNYWERERDSSAGTKYRNERIFGVKDVHLDTTAEYRALGDNIIRIAENAEIGKLLRGDKKSKGHSKGIKGWSSRKEKLSTERSGNVSSGGSGQESFVDNNNTSNTAPSSPIRSWSIPDLPPHSGPKEVINAAKSRGHGTVAAILAERLESSPDKNNSRSDSSLEV